MTENTDSRTGKGVTIRFSGPEDIGPGIALARRVHAESAFADLPFDEMRVRKGIERGLGAPDRHCLLQAEFEEEMVGYLHGVANRHYFSNALGATIMSYYVVPEHRGTTAAVKLLHGFRRWERQRGAVRLHVGVTSGVTIERTDRLMKRLGFHLVGGNYMLKL